MMLERFPIKSCKPQVNTRKNFVCRCRTNTQNAHLIRKQFDALKLAYIKQYVHNKQSIRDFEELCETIENYKNRLEILEAYIHDELQDATFEPEPTYEDSKEYDV